MAANKTSPDTIPIPLITHITDGRRWRRRDEGLGAERQREAHESELNKKTKQPFD